MFVVRYYGGGSIEEALRTDYRFSVHQAINLAVHALDALGSSTEAQRDAPRCQARERGHGPGPDHGYPERLRLRSHARRRGEAPAVLGTDHYRPPEAKSSGKVGRSADLFGLGMTLFEMLNGRLPMGET